MNLINNRFSRQKLQINVYKILISIIVFAAIIYLITDEEVLFSIN